MKDNFDAALKALLGHEGGYVNHPLDPGGMTNLGVTKSVWEEWVGHPVTEKVMRGLTPADVAPMYRRKYWDRVRGDELPSGLDYLVFDAAVNAGPGRAIKWLQVALGVGVDGDFGPKTMAAVNAAPKAQLIEKYSTTRLEFLKALTTWYTFGKGWERRVSEVKTLATKMIA